MECVKYSNPLMHNVPNGQIHFKSLAAFAARFLKCVLPFRTLCIKGLKCALKLMRCLNVF